MRERNLLDTGEVSPGDVAALLQRCRGTPDQYAETPHHAVRDVPVHVFKPVVAGVRWYVKVYFVGATDGLEPAIFISVHRSGH